MSSPVDKIKERLSVEEVVGSYLKLEKSGTNFKARCPFHNEKTPSFFVSPDRGNYYCFGCGAKGDIFTFVQEFEGLDFKEALKMLAEKAGVELPKESSGSRSERDKLFKVLDEAAFFYQEKLKENKEALKYLKGRGLDEKTIKEWRIGFAPKGWRHTLNHLKENGYSESDLLKVGLIKKNQAEEGKESYYDVFRNRIVFPIFDTSERIIAFSGRLFGNEEGPKYLNTPETQLFNKGETLYGLHKAKLSIRKKDFSILVEGQMDLLMCHQAGFPNTVASSGTAFSETHLMRLKKLSNRVLLVFDGDEAGFNASKKSAALGLSLGMEVKVAPLPKGTDPAELIQKDLEVWKNILRSSKHIIDHYLDTLISEGKTGRTLAKVLKDKILPFVALVPSSIEKSEFVSSIAKKTGIREEAIWDDLRTTERLSVEEVPQVNKEFKKELKSNYVIRRVAGILFWLKGSSEPILEYEPLSKRIREMIGEDGLEKLFKEYENEKEELIFEAENYYREKDTLERDLAELLALFEEDILKDHFVSAMAELEKAETEKNEEKVKELLNRCQDISMRLAQIKNGREVLSKSLDK